MLPGRIIVSPSTAASLLHLRDHDTRRRFIHLLRPCPCVAAILPKPLANAKPSRADSDERWDAHKAKKPAASLAASSASSSSSSGPRSSRGSATSPPKPKPGRADSVQRWDAHKKAAAILASSSSSPSSSLVSSSSSKSPISRADRWDVHKEHRRPPQADQRLDDDGESSSTGSNDIDIDTDEEEEILWKPRALYAGPGFAVAAPEPRLLPMPTSLLVPVA